MPDRKELVLVGGGHSHVQVLRRWMMRPLPDVRLTVILDRPEAVYSGMVPGFVAGDYAPHELEIDVVPLARRAGAAVVLAAATRVDPVQRRIEVEGRPSIGYEVASLDVGSSVRGLDVPGVREHALATRPIRDLVDQLDARLAAANTQRGRSPLRLAIAGGGAAGLELAFTLHARLARAEVPVQIDVLSDAAQVATGFPAAVGQRVLTEARARDIHVRTGVRVVAVEKDCVETDEGRLACDLAVWATGAAPLERPDVTALPLDAAGFIRVESTLEVVGQEGLFAAGDCASLDAHPWVPKAGVYAVRQGPYLDANLRARLRDRPLRRYKPQRDFLSLFNLGEQRALGAKWGRVAVGGGVWKLKDWIDRRFMRRFGVLSSDGTDDARDFPTPESMGMEEMACGGCAAKVGASDLERALARLDPAPADASVRIGLDRPDDVAELELRRGDRILATVDAFRAFADDPWLVGRAAATNALSDVWAKGGTPRHALALVTVPDDAAAEETLFQVVAGIRAALDAAGVALVGGHSTRGPELFVGLSVTGEPPESGTLELGGLRAGDALILTRPLGSGVLLAADMQGRARGAWVRACHAQLVRPNDAAARIARERGVHAATDVSGFGLAGHLAEMLRAAGLSARLDLDRVPLLPGALELVSRGIRSTYHDQNARGRRGLAIPVELGDHPAVELLFDPQTSGGLLLGVASADADACVAALRSEGDGDAARIGEAVEAAGPGVGTIAIETSSDT